MAIRDDDIERVRSASSLVDVVGQYVAMRRVGRNYVGLCPFHAEKTGSFNVREETGRYKCFGCQAAGDVFRFVQDIEHVDFVAAVELLAGKAGITLQYTTGGEGRERKRRSKLVETLAGAVDWYHDRLLNDPQARPAREYLRRRGISGDTARAFKLGWAPDEWDGLARGLGVPADLLRDTGLAYTNRSGRLQDAFRSRVMFPIFSDNGDPVAFGGRVLPGSDDPAKYKNSPETAVYAKSRTLYGLNWAKADIVNRGEVVVCEGYTDVIGFHGAGVARAVATCGTALTEEHVRVLKRFAGRVVLAFDADGAGQGAAEKFYEWEERHKVEVRVAHFPDGQDPADLASRDPEALRRAVSDAVPFLGFRVQRAIGTRVLRSPEERARAAQVAMGVVNEHPDRNVRKLYAGQVAAHTGLPAADLVGLAERGAQNPSVRALPVRRARLSENAEFAAVTMLLQRWDAIAPLLIEALFADDVHRRAFNAVAEAAGSVEGALALADPEAREVIERAAVADLDLDPEAEAVNLVSAAVRRELSRRVSVKDPEQIRADREARLILESLASQQPDPAALDALLGWLNGRHGEHNDDRRG